jgi:pyrimidine deaminase RibD-like protein/8-oxo-dGTP pyrophosphatase MutT (NUDIX family)/GNAT superfamily N-acetyltransferase
MILTDLFESQEMHNQDRLDSVLGRCIELIHEKHHANPKKYGKVAACIIDVKNRKVFGINSPGPNGTRRHAERMAIDRYHERYGKILPGAIIVTTLSPCNRDMVERDGPSCQDLLLQNGIEKVYSGYMDPSQHSDHPFTEEMTQNDDLWRRCKEFSDSFVHDDLSEDRDRPRAAGCILYAQDTGRYGLQQRSDTVNDPSVWAAWGGGRELGETLEQCATRELAEESGYTGPLKLKRLAENSKYTTFIGVVPHEFEPRACSEWKDYCWVDAGNWPGPMHPGVAEALKNIPANKQQVAEAFDQPYKILRWEKGDYGDVDAIARLDDNTFLSIMFNKGFSQGSKEEAWSVEFYRNNSQEVTGEGDAQRVFATVLSAIQTFIKKYKPNRVIFSASKEVEQGQNAQSRARLYDSLVQRYAKAWGFRAFRADTGNKVIYELSRINKGVAENFADGQNPVKFTVTTPDGYTHSFQITLTVHGKHVGHFNFVRGADTDDVNNEAEVESRWQGQGYGKLLLMKAIDVANNHGLDFQQDIRGITDAQQNVYDSLENAGSIVTPGDGFWFLTPQGEQELNGLNENFADGRNPQDKGDAKRHGVPTKASVSTLRKVAKQGGRKGQLAHWMANMKAGRAKARKK